MVHVLAASVDGLIFKLPGAVIVIFQQDFFSGNAK